MRKSQKILATLLLAGAALACATAYFSSRKHTHAYTETVTAPTCTEDGFTTYTCECEDSYTDNPVQKLGHTESDWIVDQEATYEEAGSQHKECTVCHDILQTEDLPVLEKPASEGLSYTLSDDETYYIVSGIGTCEDTDIIIPSTYEGKPVKEIGEMAFTSCVSLTSVEIPDSVTSIGYGAFGNCTSLRSVVIPDSVTSIGELAFVYCSSLTSVVIPDSVTSIDESAFAGCLSLTSITVDQNNEYYQSIDGNLYTKDGKTLIQYAIGKTATSFAIPDSVTSIGGYAFYYCDSLTSVEIPDRVTSIGERAFGCCTSLTSVVIGDSVTSIGSFAFYSCTSLTSVVIGDSVTSIGGDAFRECTSLTSVVIGDSVTSIGSYAFYSCTSLTSVYYKGTESDWEKISIGSSNSKLTNATRYYYSETQPTTSGNYWHYDENGNVVVW